MKFLLIPLVGLLLLIGNTSTAHAQAGDAGAAKSPPPSASRKARNKSRAKERERIGPQRQQKLLGFVREHHPELENLLKTLQEKRPDKYRSAIRALNQSYERLLQLEGDPKKYHAALRNWKLKSRIDLLAARIAIKDNPQQREKLKKLVAQHVDARANQLRAEKKRLEQRMAKIDQQLARVGQNREQEVERQFELALRKIRNALGIAKSSARKSARASEQSQNADPVESKDNSRRLKK